MLIYWILEKEKYIEHQILSWVMAWHNPLLFRCLPKKWLMILSDFHVLLLTNDTTTIHSYHHITKPLFLFADGFCACIHMCCCYVRLHFFLPCKIDWHKNWTSKSGKVYKNSIHLSDYNYTTKLQGKKGF